MSAIAHERLAGPRAPRFLATAWDVFVGFLAAAVVVGIATFAAFATGIVGHVGTTSHRDAIDWPFVHDGLWSLAANAVVTAAMLLICAACISDLVGRRVGAPVSIARTFAIVAITGYAPFVAFRGVLPLHFLLGLLATTFLVRRYSVGVERLHLSSRVRLTFRLACVSLLVIPAAYGLTHPLWYSSVVATSRSPSSDNSVVYHPRADTTVSYGFALKNSSLARVRLLGVSGGSAPFFRVVGAARGIRFPGERVRPLAGSSVGGHGLQFVTLFIRVMGCDRLTGTASLDRVAIHYRVAGMSFSAPVPLAVRPTLDCPA